MTTEPVTVTVEWTPTVLTDGTRAFQKSLPRRNLWILFGIVSVVMFVIFSLGDKILLSLYDAGTLNIASYRDGYGDGVIVFVLMCVICVIIFTVAQRMMAPTIYAKTPFFERPCIIELSLHGIRTQGPYNHGHIDWAAVTASAQTKTSLVLSLGGGGYLPLPFNGFPEGLSANDLEARIESWRAAGDF